MKKIKFSDDLNDTIEVLNGKMFKRFKKEIILMTTIVFTIASLISPFIIPNCSYFSVKWTCCTLIYYVFALPSIAKMGIVEEERKFEKTTEKANNEMCQLVDELQKENIKVEKQNLIKSNQRVENIKIENGEKIIRYFYLLDREEQIQILKQISNNIQDHKTINEMFLYEKADIEKAFDEGGISIQKTIKLSKKA